MQAIASKPAVLCLAGGSEKRARVAWFPQGPEIAHLCSEPSTEKDPLLAASKLDKSEPLRKVVFYLLLCNVMQFAKLLK